MEIAGIRGHLHKLILCDGPAARHFGVARPEGRLQRSCTSPNIREYFVEEALCYVTQAIHL